MKINRKLNLVIPLDLPSGKAYVHSTPISQAAFEANFLTITKTYAAMTANGGEWMLRSGPRTALLMLKRVAQADGTWDGADGIANGFLNEMRRMTNVVMPVEGRGWDTLPYQEVVDKRMVEADDLREVDNALTFFTVCSASMRPSETAEFLGTLLGLLDGQLTSSNAMEWQNSLTTSTQTDSTGARETLSSIPV